MDSGDISRRSWMDWLGKATVLALGSDLLAACGATGGGVDGGFVPDGRADGGDGGLSHDGDTQDGGGDAQRDGGGAFPFEPPPAVGSLYEDFRVRTVDRQDLEQILSSWTLRIDGLVERPQTLSFADIVGLDRQDQVTDFHCVEGWSVLDVPWNGVHLSTLFDLAGPTAAATHVTFHTINSQYNESLPLDIALEPKTLLAYGIGGSTIPLPHGFPLRIVIPRLLAYKSAKYVDRIELADGPINGFWVASGYDYTGEVPDRRLRPGKY